MSKWRNQTFPGQIRLFPSGYYHIAVPVRDRKLLKWVSIGTKDRLEAHKIVETSGADRLVHLAQAKALTEQTLALVMAGRRITYESILKGWEEWTELKVSVRTMVLYKRELVKMIASFELAQVALSMVDHKVVDAWVNSGETSLSVATIRYAACVSFFNYASAHGYLTRNPMALVKPNPSNFLVEQIEPKKIPPMPDECYLAAINFELWPGTWYRDALIMAFTCGLRFIDVCKLEFGSLSPTSVVVYPRKSRRHERRVELPLSDPLVARPEFLDLHARIMAMPRRDDIPWVWPQAAVGYDEPGQHASMKSRFYSTFRQLGFQVSFHSARVAFARRWEAAGRPLEQIQSVMGHGSPWTTKGYLTPVLTPAAASPP